MFWNSFSKIILVNQKPIKFSVTIQSSIWPNHENTKLLLIQLNEHRHHKKDLKHKQTFLPPTKILGQTCRPVSLERLLCQQRRAPHELRLRAVRPPGQRVGSPAERRPEAAAPDQKRSSHSHQWNAPSPDDHGKGRSTAPSSPEERQRSSTSPSGCGRSGLQLTAPEQRQRIRFRRILRIIRQTDRLRRRGSTPARPPPRGIRLCARPLLHAVTEKVQWRISTSLRRL